jgi:hypothetical protein
MVDKLLEEGGVSPDQIKKIKTSIHWLLAWLSLAKSKRFLPVYHENMDPHTSNAFIMDSWPVELQEQAQKMMIEAMEEDRLAMEDENANRDQPASQETQMDRLCRKLSSGDFQTPSTENDTQGMEHWNLHQEARNRRVDGTPTGNSDTTERTSNCLDQNPIDLTSEQLSSTGTTSHKRKRQATKTNKQ